MTTTFNTRSRAFLTDVSKAAAWMMERNFGYGHWWRWFVLTSKNQDPLKRPIFDDQTAQRIFRELEERGLIFEVNVEPDASGAPAYLMRYDAEGWDKAVADGRPFYGAWLKFKRNWIALILFFILGCLFASFEGRTVGLIDKAIDSIFDSAKDHSGP